MKRLIKKAFEIKLYHGTNLENLRSITDSGMMFPQEAGGAGNSWGDDSKFEGYTFFATTLDKAWAYANMSVISDEDVPVVLQLSLPENSLLPDDNDCPECKDWNESSNKVKQVKVLGQIASDYFEKVHFDLFGNESVVNFKGWEKDFENLENTNSTFDIDQLLMDDEEYEEEDEEKLLTLSQKSEN